MRKIPPVKNGIQRVTDFLAKPKKEKTIRDILGDKAPVRTEIEVSFFQACNVKCAFCWQDNNDTTGLETIREKVMPVITYLHSSDHLLDDINITLTGGELFQDGVLEDIYHDLAYFMLEISDHCNRNLSEKNINFTLISSLPYSEDTYATVKRLFALLDAGKVNYSIATSWDAVGRPLGRWRENLSQLGDKVDGMTMVITKQAIKKFLSKDLNVLGVFENLANQYRIELDYYVPTSTADSMMPSDTELRDFFIFMVDNFPNVGFIEAWMKSKVNPISCGSLNKMTIMPDGSLLTCRQPAYSKEEFNKEIIPNSNSNIIENFMGKNECLSCEYYDRCTLSCFVMSDHKSFKRDLEYCFYKDVHKYIEEKR
jgi:radical SAM protein with 4Fe4S-binding SPASM domain